jgi:hypothetical protein
VKVTEPAFFTEVSMLVNHSPLPRSRDFSLHSKFTLENQLIGLVNLLLPFTHGMVLLTTIEHSFHLNGFLIIFRVNVSQSLFDLMPFLLVGLLVKFILKVSVLVDFVNWVVGFGVDPLRKSILYFFVIAWIAR